MHWLDNAISLIFPLILQLTEGESKKKEPPPPRRIYAITQAPMSPWTLQLPTFFFINYCISHGLISSDIVCCLSHFFIFLVWLILLRHYTPVWPKWHKNMLRAFQWTWKILGICKMMSAIIYTALMVLHYFWFWSQYFHKQFWNKNVIII